MVYCYKRKAERAIWDVFAPSDKKNNGKDYLNHNFHP